ncbi:MAG: DNA modification methylase [Chloroflexi bacterium]|nr:DNA modification methylase [Chloroflexota bacterium]
MSLPVHGWFRFSAGFSASWARSVIEQVAARPAEVVLLDPFAGVGTAVLAGEEAGVASLGLEAQPFIARVAKAKLLWNTPVPEFQAFATRLLELAKARPQPPLRYPVLIHKCYSPDVLDDLHVLRCAWERLNNETAVSELAWLALTAILRPCSPAGTAPWQYVLPTKLKASTPPPLGAFAAQVRKMSSDMTIRQMLGVKSTGKIWTADARTCLAIPDEAVTLVITSPPYMNNYDYADATRLEMSFWGEVQGWGDLHQTARQHLIRSSSQHVSADKLQLGELLAQLSGVPFAEDLTRVCNELSVEREHHGGKKAYHLMTAAYFADMAKVWASLRRVCKQGAKVCFVIGDSAPYGLYVPVDEWLGQLALAAGFKSCRFEKIRDRNVKWRNRKHKVPLKEGRLWVEG